MKHLASWRAWLGGECVLQVIPTASDETLVMIVPPHLVL